MKLIFTLKRILRNFILKKRTFISVFLFAFVFENCNYDEHHLDEQPSFIAPLPTPSPLPPIVNYEKEAEYFFNLMASRYSFWDVGSPQEGDKDSFEDFQTYYILNKKKFSYVNFNDAINLFKNWIVNLSDGHLSMRFTHPIFLKDVFINLYDNVLSYIGESESLFVGTKGYIPILERLGFHLLEDKTYIDSTTLNEFDVVFAEIPSKKDVNEKILYLSFSGFENDLLDEFMLKKFINFFKVKPRGLILDLRSNRGGSLVSSKRFSYLFKSANKNIGGIHDKFFRSGKYRMDIDPKAKKSAWKPIILSDFIKKFPTWFIFKGLSDDMIQNIYDTPIVVLMGGRTFSAAESVCASLRQREKVTLIGKKTGGVFSLIYPKLEEKYERFKPPYDGGTFEYRDEKGEVTMEIQIGKGVFKFRENEVEGKGISPDIEVNEEFYGIYDQVNHQIKKALELLEN